ncbi:signal peptidase I [Sedimentibacter hydroxybenzoicus DSM 7310]|uniref:Signal peptidase I n=2 Tax=Sedimentibacter hydroxybenzoicus TaxID=29345 RepID=A0A974BK04_SEDHY|nr:signal peptidase I [Sedimentibacter hydroxybenzoicus DSM 7310]
MEQRKTKFIPTRASYKNCILVIMLTMSIYILENSPAASLIGGTLFTYVIKPLLWFGVAVFIWQMPHIKPTAKLRHKKFIYLWAFIFGVAYVLINLLAGLLGGIGKSPYSHSLLGIIKNLIYVVPLLTGGEFVRSYLVNSITKKENYFVFIMIALLMTFTSFSINKYLGLSNIEGTVQFAAEYFAPEFSHNLFATYLVYLGGPSVSIIYLGIIQGFHWLSPILPNLKWINTALIGILCPIFFLMTFNSVYSGIALKKKQKEDDDILSWIVTSIVSIAMIWFAVGVFPIYPSVIVTGSMEPEIKPGDVILVEKITGIEDINNLKVNDVIQFQRDGIFISHRIIDILNTEENGLQFKTKGDNNQSPDTEPVKSQDIRGTIKYKVSKIGWLTMLIKSDKEISIDL